LSHNKELHCHNTSGKNSHKTARLPCVEHCVAMVDSAACDRKLPEFENADRLGFLDYFPWYLLESEFFFLSFFLSGDLLRLIPLFCVYEDTIGPG